MDNTNNEIISKIHSILACLSLFFEFKNEFIVYSQEINNKMAKLFVNFFKIFGQKNPDNEINAISGLIKEQDIKNTFSQLLDLLEDEYFINHNIKKNVDTSDYDENIIKNKFLERHKNGSIIERYFFGVREIKKYCLNCGLTTYNFVHYRFLEIDLNYEKNEIILNEKYLIKNKESMEKCKFCSEKNKCEVEKILIEFPKNIILIFEGNDFYKFIISKNICISINNKYLYNLICFIEEYSNIVYYKDNNNWYKYLG